MPRPSVIRIASSVRLWWRSGFHYYRRSMLRPPYWVSAGGRIARVAAADDAGASGCYAEVIGEDCYGVYAYARRASPQVIVDIGANVGMFSKLCSLLFPNAEIHAFEPNPSALKWLRENAAGTRIEVSPTAVTGDSQGVARLDTTSDSTVGRIAADGDLLVDCTPADQVAGGRVIDLLKMDCEGAEWSILRDTTLLRRTREFCLEYHLVDGHSFEEMRALIESAGHRIVEIKVARNWLGTLRSVRSRQSADR